MQLSFRHYYWRWLKNLAILMSVYAILMTIARLGFAFYFGDVVRLMDNSIEVKRAFWLGFRFDLIPLAYVTIIPFTLLHLGYFLPGKWVIRSLRPILVSLLFCGYLSISWLYVFDYGFYSYFQDHINILFFGFFEDDTKALLISIHKNYNLILWGFVLVVFHYGLFRFVKFLFSPFDFDLRVKKNDFKPLVVFIFGGALLGIMGRGNFSRLPLSVEDAHISSNEFINEIALNGALTLNRAIKIRKTYGKDNYNYLKNDNFKDWKEAFAAYKGIKPGSELVSDSLVAKTSKRPFLEKNPPHVVVVVMESFGSFWNEADGADFQILGGLKEHFRDGILFKNFLPSENGTIGSIVSAATAQVIRPGARFLSESEYMNTHLSSSGNIPFKRSGYETHFVYGGKLGWRDLGRFLKVQGFDKLWGADEIKEAMPELNHFAENDLGNEWGIFDEYLYSFIDEHLRTSTKPQLFFVLTTSNHPPFEYPSSYQQLPLNLKPELLSNITISEELARKRFLGLQYANQKMGDFLDKIKRSSLNDNTIIALTGDHSFWIAKGVEQEEEFKRYAVPFFLSIPSKYRPGKIDSSKFGSHEDIFPTLINLSLSDQTYIKLGEDLFGDDSVAVNSSGLIANKSGAFHHDKFWRWLDINHQILIPSESTPELLELKRKAMGQIGLTDAYLKSEKNRKQTAEGNDLR
jgi:phosphoglycerol transferase MdoB-like AlkP superfamily enzyme